MSKSNVTQNIVLFTSKEFFSLFKPQLLEELDYSLNNCILNIVVLCPSTYTASIHCSFSSIRVSKIFIPLRPLAIREFLQGINCIPIENSDDSKTKVLDEANNQIALLNYPLKTKPLHVAVIENSANNLRVAKRMLEKLGALVETSRTGTGIYDFIVDNHRSFDFILMDCRFPDMDGFETTLKIREYEKKNNLPRLYIIALSSYSLDSHLKKLQECGMDGALVKPVTYKMLAETVLSYKASSNPLNPTLSKISFKHVHNSMQNSASFSVLVVEDDEMTRWILTTQLNSIGCQVFEAVDGVSALQMMILGCSSGLQRQKLHINSIDSGNECEEKESLYFLDFVFMDCLMPGQDGFECTRMFRRYESKSVTSRAPIPVIGLTADSAFNTRLKCLNSGMNECILKPVSLETLVSILKKFGKYSPKHEKNLLP
jgi:CheY-like chemotaxis protein